MKRKQSTNCKICRERVVITTYEPEAYRAVKKEILVGYVCADCEQVEAK